MSKRFAMKRYLGLSEDDIALNEKLWREEQAVDHATEDTGTTADLRSVGVGGGGFEDFGEEDFDDEDLEGEESPEGEDIPGGEIDLESPDSVI